MNSHAHLVIGLVTESISSSRLFVTAMNAQYNCFECTIVGLYWSRVCLSIDITHKPGCYYMTVYNPSPITSFMCMHSYVWTHDWSIPI